MSITAIDYFCSNYFMSNQDIIQLLDNDTLTRVENTFRGVEDYTERKQKEALMLWRIMPQETKQIMAIKLELCLSSDIKCPVKKQNSKMVKKYKVCKNKSKRKMIMPINTYVIEYNRYIKHIPSSEKENLNPYELYKIAFKRLIDSGELNIIWSNINPDKYSDKNEKKLKCDILPMFVNMPYSTISKFKPAYALAVFAVHSILVCSGLYDDYPTFKDFNNFAAHIVLKGKIYMMNVLKDTNSVRDLLEYDNFHTIWDRTMRSNLINFNIS